MRFARHFMALAAGFAAVSMAAAAQAPDPAAMLRGAVDEVMAVVYDSNPPPQPLSVRVRPVLEKYFDFDAITRRAVGPGWRQFTPAQQQHTTSLFADLVLRTYADRFEVGDKPGITYASPVELSPTKRELPTTIDYAGKKYSVAYRLELVAGQWKIYDVVIEGVSMIANYRAQFDPMFQRGGAAEIIRSLGDKLAQLNAAK